MKQEHLWIICAENGCVYHVWLREDDEVTEVIERLGLSVSLCEWLVTPIDKIIEVRNGKEEDCCKEEGKEE